MTTEAYIIVSADYPPHMGGVERYSWHLAGELKTRGYMVYVLTSSMKGEPQKTIDERGVCILRFPSIWVIPDRMPVVLPTNKWSKLKMELQQYYSIRIIVQTNLYPLSLKSLHFAKQNNINSMMIIHGSNFVCLGKRIIDIIEHLYERWIVEKAKKNNALFAAVSKASALFAESLGCQVETIAYNAIPYQVIENVRINEQNAIRNIYKLSETSAVFIFVGRMIREKGVLQLVNAFSRLTETADAVLIMIGDGPLLTELKNQRMKNIFFTGEQPHQEVIRFLKQADCFILPSDSEGFPTTVLEAADCDCYIIAAPFGGQKEAAQLVNGYIMKDNSEESIYHACLYYLNHSKELMPAMQTGKKRMKETINWQKTVDKIINVFDNK